MNKVTAFRNSELAQQIHALCRYQTHGGYVFVAVMSDGEVMCVPCVLEHYRQIIRATIDHPHSGWAIQGIDHSGNSESLETCAHCHKLLWDHSPALLTYDEALEQIGDERHISADDVEPAALERTVWGMYYSALGCSPDYRAWYTTRSAAIESAIELYADEAPRGFRTALRRYGIAAANDAGYYRVEVAKLKLRELF